MLAAITVIRLGQSIAAVVDPWAWDYAEPIVYGQAARLLKHEPLYQALGEPPFTVTAYTPLYYYAVAGVHALLGPGFAVGRTLSFLSGLVAAVCVAALTTWLARSAWAGVVAATIFLGLGFTGSVPWFALYRVDTLGLAFSLLAICVSTVATRPRDLIAAGVLAGLALLTKQTFFAAFLAPLIWLLPNRRRDAVLFGATALITVGAPCVLFAISTPAFVENTILANVNPIAPAQVGFLLPAFEFSLGPPLVLAGLQAITPSSISTSSSRLIVLYWVFSAVTLLGLLKFGAFYNYWIEFAAGTAVLSTLCIWSTRSAFKSLLLRILSFAPIWLLILDLAWIAYTVVITIPPSVALAQDAGRRAEFRQLVERVRNEPSPVLAEPMDVLVLADRPILLEPVIFGILQRQGMWNPAPLVRSVCDGDVKLLVLEVPLPTLAEYAPFGVPWWPEPVIRALQARMQPIGQLAGRQLYAPAPANQQPSTTPVCR